MRRRRVSAAERRAYTQRVQADGCFVCTLVRGEGSYHEVVLEGESAIAFLNRFPTQLGYVLVASTEHREQATGDYSEEEYVALQRVVYRVAEAVRRVVPTERVYVLSLGSQQGNRHVHWHVVALPPGVPYDKQQLAALDWERAGVLELGDDERAELGAQIRAQLR